MMKKISKLAASAVLGPNYRRILFASFEFGGSGVNQIRSDRSRDRHAR